MRYLAVYFVVSCGFLSLTSCSENPNSTQTGQSTKNGADTAQPQSATHLSGDFVRETNDQDATPRKTRGHIDPIRIGDRVPDFLVAIDGKSLKLSQLQKNTKLTEDGVIVLTFWCSFCHSCRDVELRLQRLASEVKGKAAVVALDCSAGETHQKVADFAKKRGLTFPIALDSIGNSADIFGTQVTTTTVVIDRQGVLRYCGQFGTARHPYAADALKAVLTGKEVADKTTKQMG